MLYKQKETHVNHKQTLDIESLVPQNHLVRKLNKIDLSFIYDMVESLYAKNGPLSIDPVLLFKILIIQHVFGISSMRRTITEIEVNVAYRWYLGLNFTDKIPHHSTFGKNYEWRFKDTQIFNNIFSKILELIRNNGFIDDTTVFIDGTHVKANANNKKAINKTIEIEEHPYQKDIDAAITESRKLHNKKPLKEKTTIEHKDIKSSTTDPDCGLFHKGEHKIVFATSNAGKMREIREILKDLGAEILSMKEAGVDIDIVEDGDTFAANALIKAKAVWEKTGGIVLADDSGLVIDALNGEPGVYSARYMGEKTSYEIKNWNLIHRLDGVPEKKRTARFVCVIAAVLPDGRTLTAEGTMEGVIAHEPAGAGGFGYDPILMLPEYGKTSAEITMDEKNAISHRGKALRAMKKRLAEEIGE